MTVVVNDEFSAKQTGANKITVTGSDLTATLADYTIRRGNTNIAMAEVAVNEAKTEAVLTAGASSLTAGTYTAVFGDKTAEFTVEAAVIDNIEIIGDVLVLDSAYPSSTGTVAYAVYNQFGEDITKRTSNMNASTTFGSGASAESSTGTIKVSGINSAYVLGASGTVVLVNTTTGKSVTKTVTLSNVARADSFEVLGVYNKVSGKAMTLSENADNTSAAVLVAVKDQYGRTMRKIDTTTEVAINFAPGITNLSINTTNTYEDVVTVDGLDYVALDIIISNSSPIKTGTATLVLVSKTTGKNVNYTLEVSNTQSVYSFDVYTLDNVYAGEKNEFGFVALAQDGTEIKDYKTLSNDNYGVKLPTVGSGTNPWSWELNSDGSASLCYTPGNLNLSSTNTSTTQSASFQVASSFQYKTLTFTVYEKARPNSLGNVRTPAQDSTYGKVLGVVSGESVSIDSQSIIVYDQYGRQMSADKYADTDYSGYRIMVRSIANGRNGARVISAAAVNALTASDILTLTPAGLTMLDTAQVTVALSANGTDVISGSESTLVFTAAPMEALTNFTASMADNVYSKGTGAYVENQVSVTATATNGRTVSVPRSMFSVYGDVVTPAGIGTNAKLDGTRFDSSLTTANATLDQTVRVVIANAAGTEVIKTVKVSNEAPKVVSAGQSKYTITVASAASIGGLLDTIWTSDQYSEGGSKQNNLLSANVINYADADDAGFVASKNNTSELSVTASARDKFTVLYTWKSGHTLTCTYTVQ